MTIFLRKGVVSNAGLCTSVTLAASLNTGVRHSTVRLRLLCVTENADAEAEREQTNGEGVERRRAVGDSKDCCFGCCFLFFVARLATELPAVAISDTASLGAPLSSEGVMSPSKVKGFVGSGFTVGNKNDWSMSVMRPSKICLSSTLVSSPWATSSTFDQCSSFSSSFAENSSGIRMFLSPVLMARMEGKRRRGYLVVCDWGRQDRGSRPPKTKLVVDDPA
jgi:hypothetical protein